MVRVGPQLTGQKSLNASQCIQSVQCAVQHCRDVHLKIVSILCQILKTGIRFCTCNLECKHFGKGLDFCEVHW